jgi:hypothetical protein
MFNPLTPAQVVAAIGAAAREAARSEKPRDAFARGQLLSAYSGSRHLAVELDGYDPEVRAFAAAVSAMTRVAAGALPEGDGLVELADQLDATRDPHLIACLVCELLDDVREDRSPAATALRASVRESLRRLADREVDLLADAIETPGDS